MQNGELYKKKFRAYLDYSLDLIELREVYKKVYRNRFFSSHIGKNEFCRHVMNVKFKFSVKEFNRVGKHIYLKYGESLNDAEWKDGIAYKNNKLIGVDTKFEVQSPVIQEILGDYFSFDGSHYNVESNIKSVASLEDIREKLYRDGFICDGIKYVRWLRSPGSSRNGRCLFINENLYYRMHKYGLCGIRIRDGDEVDLAALESYISLTSSSIIDTIDIKPENILVIDDYESVFDDDVVSISDVNGRLHAVSGNATITNSIFDGESLIDQSIMGKYKDKGMLLLRNRFFKSCCFNSNIQKWFSDNNITDISQLNGYTRAEKVEDIKLITTPSSIKYLKFSTLKKWFDRLKPTFGIVKYEKPTHFMGGELVQTHYQLINSLQMTSEEVRKLLQPTFGLMYLLKTKPEVLRFWIKYIIEDDFKEAPVTSKAEVIYKMMSINEDFYKTKLYKDFRDDFIKSFTREVKNGHVLVNGNYSTLCGNPIEMLRMSIDKFDGTSSIDPGCIFSKRFKFDTMLLGSRSPHISMSNVLIAKNKYNSLIDTYMNSTEGIVYINSINKNILQKLAGCDFDSDALLLTDNSILINAAMKNITRFKVAVCNVSSMKKKRRYTTDDLADLDIKTSKNLIGDIVNLSQELNSIIWDKLNSGAEVEDVMNIYMDVCKLSIMSGLEIDKAKKEFVVDNAKELRGIRTKYKIVSDEKTVKPRFFGHIARQKRYYDSSKKLYKTYKTSMDYLHYHVNSYRMSIRYAGSSNHLVPFSSVVSNRSFVYHHVRYDVIENIIKLVQSLNDNLKYIYSCDYLIPRERNQAINQVKGDFSRHLGEIRINHSTMITILKRIESEENKKYRRILFYTLFSCQHTDFFRVIKESKTKLPILEEDENGTIEIFGHMYSSKYTKKDQNRPILVQSKK